MPPPWKWCAFIAKPNDRLPPRAKPPWKNSNAQSIALRAFAKKSKNRAARRIERSKINIRTHSETIFTKTKTTAINKPTSIIGAPNGCPRIQHRFKYDERRRWRHRFEIGHSARTD